MKYNSGYTISYQNLAKRNTVKETNKSSKLSVGWFVNFSNKGQTIHTAGHTGEDILTDNTGNAALT